MVGHDHPTHRRLVAGELTAGELSVWACQQWLWHRAFPGVLAMVAAQCPVPELRGPLLSRAAAEDGAPASGSAGRCAEWARVSLAFGVGADALARATPTPETATMIAVQRRVAARAFPEGWLGIMVGVDGETQGHNASRRRAMSELYGVPDVALEYVRVPTEDPVEMAVTIIEPYVDEPFESSLEALGLVLRARWDYFSGISRAAGFRGSPR